MHGMAEPFIFWCLRYFIFYHADQS